MRDPRLQRIAERNARRPCDLCTHYYVDAGFPWCSHPTSDADQPKVGMRTTYQARYPDGPCLPHGRHFERRKDNAP